MAEALRGVNQISLVWVHGSIRSSERRLVSRVQICPEQSLDSLTFHDKLMTIVETNGIRCKFESGKIRS
jgi:hypothetical protein